MHPKSIQIKKLKIMIFLALAVLCIVWHIVAQIFDKQNAFNMDWSAGKWISIIIGIIFIFVTVISVFVSRYSHYDDFELNAQAVSDLEILNERKRDLTKQFTGILSGEYLAHENQLFDKMSNVNLGGDLDMNMIFKAFPEIKANATLMELADKIFDITDDVYRKRIYLNDIRKDIKMRYNDPTVIPFVLPTVPENIKLD